MKCSVALLLIFSLSSVPLIAQQSGSIHGSVTDGETRQPIPNATVFLEGTAFKTSSDARGAFEFLSILPAHYDLVVRHVGYATKTTSLEIHSEEAVRVSITVLPTAISLSPVFVTATTARERETPVTFSNIQAAEIKGRRTVQDAPAVLSELPSITSFSWNGSDVGYTFMNLRGFDQRRLSVMVNGIPQNDPEDHDVYWIDMPDLLGFTQSIQVQRGAGDALYGPPAIGGSINVVTTPATTEPRVMLSTGFGFQEFGARNTTELNTRKYSAIVSSGLINNQYLLYGSLTKIGTDGYRQHSWVDLNSYFLGAVRFDETMTTRIHFYGGPFSDALSYVGIPRFYNNDKSLRLENYSSWELTPTGDGIQYQVENKSKATEAFSQPHYELLHEWKLNSRTALYNTFFFIQSEGYFDYDGDWIPYDPNSSAWFQTRVGYDSTFGVSNFPTFLIRGFVANKQWGWLPRVEFEHADGKLTVGGELRIHRSFHWGAIASASQLPSPTYDLDSHFYEYNGEKDMISIFGHELYRIDETLTMMADLQIAYNRYGIKNERFLGNNFDLPYLFVNPRFGMNKNVTENLNTYVSIGYTSREPTLRNLYAAEDSWFGAQPQFESTTSAGGVRYEFDKPFAKPEHLLDVEVGGSYLLGAQRITANLYWMEFQDELIKSGRIDVFGGSILLNAERTRHLGLELDTKLKIAEGLELSGNATFSANRIVKHNLYDSADSVSRTLDNNPIAGFPDLLGNARIRYDFDECSLSLLLKYVGSFHTDNLNDSRTMVDDYTVADFDASWRVPVGLSRTDVALVVKVKNLFNRLYLAGGEGNSFFPAAERNYYIGFEVDF